MNRIQNTNKQLLSEIDILNTEIERQDKQLRGMQLVVDIYSRQIDECNKSFEQLKTEN
jgi:septal ring factor EnvC (AmiA/AmiB activator)